MQASLATQPLAAARVDHDSLNPEWIRGTRPAEQVDGLRTEPHLPHPVALGTALGVRREVLDATGGFDESWPNAEDTDLCWRAARAGFSLAFVPDAVVRYRYRATPRAQFHQAWGYGLGGALLDRNYGQWGRAHRSSRVIVRTVRLVAVGRRVPRFRDRSVRATAAFEAGLLVGWLQVTLAPRRYVDPSALRQPGIGSRRGGRPGEAPSDRR
jgi:GT2 family glycosyltransferase